ncbi:outer membrane beta-barrel protein [Pararhizobium antarcticum]|uniref:Outer membrane beta-barrel protein n=1 Tax=Pararhizobium antarcticum TaxID=1798805 RepID=A0A657LRI8_9HYPH|nr:outer membrane beta-barrel protein [Pararhizobium antarcticum]OJF94508.1 hypothetical protein AX760_19855 [Pararhizobium antarcticum]OJF96648.1 hypothetical protein AX761_03535 [Rhizobium sp. 58]
MAPFYSRKTRTRVQRPMPALWLLASCAFLIPLPAVAQSFSPVAADDADTTLATTGGAMTGAATTGTAATGTQTTDPTTTASLIDDGPDAGPAVDDDLGRVNTREGTVDGLRSTLDPDRNDAPGIALGTFTLKPSLSQTINHETTKNGSSKESRSYLQTGLKGTLTSDWSRHQLTVTGEGTWQRNIGGEGATEPVANLDAELRLDISNETTGTLRAGYRFEREDSTDPNAISGASVQSGIDRYSLGAGVQRDFGILRGSAKVDFERYVYGSAELSDGTDLSLSDRDRNAGTVTARIGYELSPALIPFLEASVGRSVYDLRRDTLGFERSYDNYAGRAGLQVDLGEKMNGEIALGYETYRFKDSRLDDLSGLTVDSTFNWSPQRGTIVTYGVSTGIEPSTTAGESGALVYALNSGLTHELRSSLVARLSNSLTFRNYPSGSSSEDQKVWLAGAGLSWDMTRSLALTGDVSYERTMQTTGPSTNVAKIGVGLTLKR